ncbi:MAG: hypothetical protein HYY84_01450 [Deltaproteobacteria bacterium]|nr:hypothetical protein [Deltaproteobacteria bacterium]
MKVTAFDSGDARAEKVVDFKARLAANDARLIPPTRRSELDYYAPDHPYLRHARVKHFCVESGGGDVVGATTAIVDEHLPSDVGLVGLFQSTNDPAVANLVLGAARDYLAAAGKRVVKGPVDYNIWYRYRFKTGGFDRATVWGEPDNPDYYAKLWTEFGFTEEWTWRSYDLTRAHVELLLANATAHTKDLASAFRLERWTEPDEAKFRDFHRLVAGSYQGNPLATAIDFDEFSRIYGFFLYFLHVFQMHFVVLPDGTRIGVAFGMPDVAPAFRGAKGGDVTPDAVTRAGAASDTFLFHTIAIGAEHRGNQAINIAFRDYLSAVGVTLPHYIGFLVREPKPIYIRLTPPSRHYALFTMNV